MSARNAEGSPANLEKSLGGLQLQGVLYKETFVFLFLSLREKGDKRKTRLELPHPDKNFLLFKTHKINLKKKKKDMYFLLVGHDDWFGEMCRSDETKELTTFSLKCSFTSQGKERKVRKEAERKPYQGGPGWLCCFLSPWD